jgi:hypothetical protein
MTEESEHYMCASQVHKSPATYLDIAQITRYKHICRPDLHRVVFAMFSAIAVHIAKIILASGPQWRPHGELQHNTAPNRSCFVSDYGM